MKILKIVVLLLAAVLVFTSCSMEFLSYFNRKTMNGDKNVLGRTYDMASGSEYSIVIKDIMIESFTGTVVCDETLSDSLVIATDENIFLSFDVNVDNDNRIITVQGNSDYKYIPTTFEITVGGIIGNIDISGAFKIDMKFSESKTPNIKVDGAVSGTVLLDNAESVTFDVNGAADITLDGTVGNLTANISGAATISGYELKTEIADLTVMGASMIRLTVNKELYVEMAGASNVYYKGDAQIMKSDINGLGEIIKED